MAKVYLFRNGGIKMNLPTVYDVAHAFLSYQAMTHKKLQKMCYYAQAWHLALYKERLFNCCFEAWVHGPVCPELYGAYKNYGWMLIPKTDGIPEILADKTDFIQAIFNTYGCFDGDQLEALTHAELPWKEARNGLEEWEPSTKQISDITMRDFYWKVYEQSQND